MPKTSSMPGLRRGARLASLLGGLLTGGGVLLAVTAAFFNVSSQPWLQPTPQVLEIAAACQAKPLRADREACVQILVASRSGPGPALNLFAGAYAASSPRR